MHQSIRKLAIAAVVALAVYPASAQTIIDPRGSTVDGKPIAAWTADWWTRFWQAPTSAIDPNTGNVSANFDNNGPVFFGPTASGDPTQGHVTIDFSVPAGRPILLPIFPFEDLEAASIDPPTATLSDRLHAADVVVAGWLGAVDPNSLFATIDGVPLLNPTNYLEETGDFNAGPTQPGSIANNAGVAAGDDLNPINAAGYWLMLENLSGGEHTISFGAQSNPFTPQVNCCTGPVPAFGVDVTWDLEVIPEPTSALLLLSAICGISLWRKRTRGT
jgi:hypothetical protein